ncbi:MAG: DUF4012 domain-containing protein [Anaerolineales bacterium]|nr:DUF4012 domain-containing protein [Anaerolineales bacterium]
MITWRRIGSLIIVLGLLILSAWIVRLAWSAQSLKIHFDQVRETAKQADLAPTCEALWALQNDVTDLRRDAGGLIALAPLFRWLPVVGNDLDAAPRLLAAGDDLAEAGSLVCESFARSGVREVSLGGVMRVFADNQAIVQQAAARATRAEQTLSSISSDALSPLLSSRVQTLQRAMPLLRAGLQLATLAPHLGGFDQPRTYLVLGLNEDELRPGGGFITGVGEVRVEAGRLSAMVFRDSYAADDFSKPYPEPPEPLYRLLGVEQWVLRDSNWSPDFPTAARQALALYRSGTPTPTMDGVIAFDQLALQELIGAVGPIRVPDSNEPITRANVVAYMRHAWAPSDGKFTGAWWLKRKSFMGTLADAARQRIETGAFDKIALAETTMRLLEGKHIQIFVDRPEAAAILRDQKWDGALEPSAGDYLMIVDANLGYNKVNARVRQSATYNVDLRAQPPRAELTLVYTNTATTNVPCVPEARYDPVYEQMANRCYWDYVRVFVPASSRLDDATRIPLPANALWRKTADSGAVIARPDGALQSFEATMILPTAQSQTRRYAWTLADHIVQREGNFARYDLYWQKQAGIPGYPVTLTVRLPLGYALIEAQPRPTTFEAGVPVFRFTLDRDQNIRLRLERR